ncbi:MAG: hypothetical protein U5L74_04330 [Ideonella sp.]|nr:hypothetical protein [Ideonella sp.]
MKTILVSIAAAVLLVATPSATVAQTTTESLGRCLGDNTSGKERKDLARWLFTAMSNHPDMKLIAKVSEADQDQATRSAAALFTRLLSETCAKEAKAAVAEGGPVAMQAGFEMLGRLAMMELMSNRDVAAAMGSLEKNMDRAKIEAAMR